MEQWKSCQEVLNELQTTFPDPGQDHQDLFSKIKQRLLEQTQGAYDFPALFRQLCNKKPRLEVATYDGPFEIKPSLIPGAGRGAFATRDIQPGELVMADKALVSAWETEPMKQITVVDIPRSRATPPLQTQLAAELMFKQFYGHPSVREKMLQLSTKGFEDLDMSTLSGIDPDRTQGVAIGYAFTLSAPPAATDNTVEGEGVFYNVSFINSQCTPNCVWVNFYTIVIHDAD